MMEDFKGNSDAQKNQRIDRDIKPITSNVTVKQQKDNVAKKIFAEDIKSTAKNVSDTVIIPKIKDFITSIIKSGVDYLFYGSGRPNTTNNISRYGNVSYGSYYNRNMPMTGPTINSTPQARIPNVYRVNDVTFDDIGDAETVLFQLSDCIDRYGDVSVANFYDMIAQKHTFEDQKYGWRDLSSARVVRIADKYAIQFPPAIPLE